MSAMEVIAVIVGLAIIIFPALILNSLGIGSPWMAIVVVVSTILAVIAGYKIWK